MRVLCNSKKPDVSNMANQILENRINGNGFYESDEEERNDDI